MENKMKFSTKLEIDLLCDPEISPLGIYLKEMKSLSGRDVHIPMLTAT